MYTQFVRHVENVNEIISAYKDDAMGDLQVYPEKGTVGFSAGLHGWAFTLPIFARMYAKKFGISEDKMTERLWGENYFVAHERKWKNTGESSDRAFNMFILDPIGKIFSACMNDQMDKLNKMLAALNIKLKKDDFELKGKALLRRTMQTWLPMHRALLEMIILNLPSPVLAQSYRAELIYTGPMNDPFAAGIRACDPAAPLMLYVSKMVPTTDKGRFHAFGRVFAGTVVTGARARIMGPNYVPGRREDLFIKAVQRVILFIGRKQEPIDSVPAGSACGLVGVDQFLARTGTIASHEDARPLRDTRFSVSPVVRCTVEPRSPQDLPKLLEGLRLLAKADPMVAVWVEESGEHVVAGAGEVHVTACVRVLKEELADGAAFKVSELVVTYRETVTIETAEECMAKSPNRHNRLYFQAAPLGEALTERIAGGEITPRDDVRVRGASLASQHGWDPEVATQIWAFGPEPAGPNLLVDATGPRGVVGLSEIKDACVAGFSWVTKEGVLAEESMRGVRFAVLDVVMHADAIHRGGGQIIPTARRAMFAAELMSGCRLLEPVYLVEIQCPAAALAATRECVARRRGTVVEEAQRTGAPLFAVRAHLPVAESFGFEADLRAQTAGRAFPTCVFDHWSLLDGDPLVEGDVRDRVVAPIRRRKGLAPAIPPIERFRDRL